jgi:hypothetical protein
LKRVGYLIDSSIFVYDIVKEKSGKCSRMTQTLCPSMGEYLSGENCVKTTHSIFFDNFSRTCNVDDMSMNSYNSNVSVIVSNENVEMKNPNVHLDDSDFVSSDFQPNCYLYGFIL